MFRQPGTDGSCLRSETFNLFAKATHSLFLNLAFVSCDVDGKSF
jgi:hypothetical protein